MRYDAMAAHGIHAFDAYGKMIAAVRECREVEGGIVVRTLVFVGDVPNPRLAAIGSNDDVVEAEAFIPGGYIQ